MLEKKEIYKRSIEKFLYFNKEMSCADMCVQLDKSLPLVTKLVNELIEEGLVVEAGFAQSTGGRRAQMFRLRTDLIYVVAVAMDQHVTRMAILDASNQLVVPEVKVEIHLAENANALQELTHHLQAFVQSSNLPLEKIAGIGIGMPGFVDVHEGRNHSFLPAGKQSIVATLQAAIGLPVVIDNDSSLIALAEQRFGEAKDQQNAMVINVSWGVGLGLILNGKLFRGDNGFAGEFSHIPMFTNNKLCSCGKMGCLETEASMEVIVNKALQGIANGSLTSIKNLSKDHLEEACNAVLQAAGKGDRFAVELLSEVAYNIGRGVAILIHLLNPGLVVLSGRGSIAGKLWLAPIQQAINENSIPKLAENTVIKVSALGKEAPLIGPAALVMDHYEELQKITAKKTVKIAKTVSRKVETI